MENRSGEHRHSSTTCLSTRASGYVKYVPLTVDATLLEGARWSNVSSCFQMAILCFLCRFGLYCYCFAFVEMRQDRDSYRFGLVWKTRDKEID